MPQNIDQVIARWAVVAVVAYLAGRLTGPAVREIGGFLGDCVKYFRYFFGWHMDNYISRKGKIQRDLLNSIAAELGLAEPQTVMVPMIHRLAEQKKVLDELDNILSCGVIEIVAGLELDGGIFVKLSEVGRQKEIELREQGDFISAMKKLLELRREADREWLEEQLKQ